MNKPRQSGGFTLLELLVVIFIATLAIGVAVANFQRSTPTAELNSQTRKLVSLMRQQRVRAMSESVVIGFSEAEEGAGYRVSGDENITLMPEGFRLSVTTAGEQSSTTRPDEILFFPDGSSSGGRCQLVSSAGSTTIQVNWLTGEVMIEAPSL